MARLTRAETQERNRARVLSAARDEFTERGFRDAKIDNIAERAELTRGGVYSNFPGKRALYFAVLADLAERAPAPAAAQPYPTAREALGAFARAWVARLPLATDEQDSTARLGRDLLPEILADERTRRPFAQLMRLNAILLGLALEHLPSGDLPPDAGAVGPGDLLGVEDDTPGRLLDAPGSGEDTPDRPLDVLGAGDDTPGRPLDVLGAVDTPLDAVGAGDDTPDPPLDVLGASDEIPGRPFEFPGTPLDVPGALDTPLDVLGAGDETPGRPLGGGSSPGRLVNEAEAVLTTLHGASQLAAAAPGFVDPFTVVLACEQLADLDTGDAWQPPHLPYIPKARPTDEPWSPAATFDAFAREPVRLTGNGVVAILGLHRLEAIEEALRAAPPAAEITAVLVTSDPDELAPLARLSIADFRHCLHQAFPASAWPRLQVVYDPSGTLAAAAGLPAVSDGTEAAIRIEAGRIVARADGRGACHAAATS